MKIVIMCAGKSQRFGTHKPKCLAEVGELPNLERTINLLYSIGHTKIDVTYPSDKKYYFHFLAGRINLIEGQNKTETQRFSNAFPLTERTVYLYGDVVYDLSDLLTIFEPVNYTTWYGRKGTNALTGKDHGELMAVQVVDILRFEKAVNDTSAQFKNKQRKMCIGWDVLEVHEDTDRRNAINFISLSNFSDDYDTQKELKQLNKIRNAYI